MDAGPENIENYVSLKMLKTNMRDALKKSGVLNSVKAQVRREFISNLAPGNIVAEKRTEEVSPEELLFRSAVFHFLKAKKWDYTLSVYSAECGVDGKSLLTESEVFNKLHLRRDASEQTFVPVLELLLRELHRRTEVVSVEASTQSDYSGVGIREMLDAQLISINKTYEAKKEQEKIFPSRGIEEKMAAFQRDCEKRMQEDFNSRLDTIREVEIAKVRLEEAHKARLELEAMRTELEANFERRMVVQAERESASLRGAADRERQLQQAQYEARQRLQRELDDLRNREQNASKKLELDNQGLRLLESRLREMQIGLEAKEKELGRREREAEIYVRDAAQKGREEARERLREELEALMRERAALKTERARLDADREAWDSVVSDAAAWRSKCTVLETDLAKRDEEIISLKNRVARLDFRQKLEIREIAELTGMALPESSEDGNDPIEAVMVDPFSNSAKSARTQHLIGLIQRCAESDARVKLLEELDRESKKMLQHEKELRESTENVLRQKQAELDRIMAFSKDFTVRVDNERRRAQKEIEKLRRECAVEKGRVTVAMNQRAEIEHLVHEQREALIQLQKSNKSVHHVRNIREHADAVEEDTDTSGKTSKIVAKIHADMAAELEWLKRRRLAIEHVEGERMSASKFASTPGASYIYGHDIASAQTTTHFTLPEVIRPTSPQFLAVSAVEDGKSREREFEERKQQMELQRAEERKRRELEEIERNQRELELHRVKDMLRKQHEENELEELRRSAEELAKRLRKQKEQELAERETELRRREADLVRQGEANRLAEKQRAAVLERKANENSGKINRALEIEADCQSLETKNREKQVVDEFATAEEELRLKHEQHLARQTDLYAQFQGAQEGPETEHAAERKIEEDRLHAEQLKEDEVSRQQKEQIERDEQDRRDVEEIAKRKELESASTLLEKFRQEDEENEATRQHDVEIADAAVAATDEEDMRSLKEKEIEAERERERKQSDDDAVAAAAKEAKNIQELLAKEAEEARQKAAADKSLAAKEEANRLRRLAAEKEKQMRLAAEREKQREIEEAQQREVEAARLVEEEANRKNEEDATALSAARARVLARRKQKQERDSLESLGSEGVASIRNSQNPPSFQAPKTEDNLSIIQDISEIEVAKNAEQSHSDDDIWF